MGLFEERCDAVCNKNLGIVKQQGKFKTVMYSVDLKDDAVTVTISKDVSLPSELMTLRVIKESTGVSLEDCNTYNMNSSGPIAFISGSKFAVSLTVEPKSLEEIDKKISELIVVSKYLRKC